MGRASGGPRRSTSASSPRDRGRLVQRADGLGGDARPAQRLARALDDALQVVLDRRGDGRRLDRRRQPRLDQPQVDLGAPGPGDLDLRALGLGRQRVAQALLDDRHQPRVQHRVGVPALQPAQLGHAAGVVDGVDQVPGGEIEVDPAGHLARRAAGLRRAQAAIAQQRHQRLELDAAVEVRAGDVHAVVGQDVVAPVGAAAALGADAHDREVRGAAADVGDEHQFLGRDVALVVQRGGDRLVLEGDLAEAGGTRRGLQRRRSLGVALGVVVDEEHRAAEHDARQRRAGRRLRGALQMAQIADDHVHIAHRMAAAEVGRLLQQRGAEQALHRAHQAAVVALDVGGHRGTAVQPRRFCRRMFLVETVEDRGRHRRVAGLELDQTHAVGSRQGDARVRGAEVDRSEAGCRVHGDCRSPKGRGL